MGQENVEEDIIDVDNVLQAPVQYPDIVTDYEEDVPKMGNAIFCGNIIGVGLISSGFVKRSVMIVKDICDVSPHVRTINDGETDGDESDDDGIHHGGVLNREER